MFLQLWNVRWVTSFRLKQRRGFLGIREMRKEAPALEEKLDGNKKIGWKDDVKLLEKKYKDSKKGTSWFWKSEIEVMKGISCSTWLTAVLDSQMC